MRQLLPTSTPGSGERAWFLAAHVHGCLIACLPVLPFHALPACLPACQPAFVPACMLACPPACLLACMHTCLPAGCLPTCLFVCALLPCCWLQAAFPLTAVPLPPRLPCQPAGPMPANHPSSLSSTADAPLQLLPLPLPTLPTPPACRAHAAQGFQARVPRLLTLLSNSCPAPAHPPYPTCLQGPCCQGPQARVPRLRHSLPHSKHAEHRAQVDGGWTSP